jgi:hypothetical protein
MTGYLIIYGILLAITVGLIVVSGLADEETARTLLAEGGPVETASVVAYVGAAVMMLIQALKGKPARWCLMVLTLCLAFRELDFDKRFTVIGIFKGRFYFSPDVPVHQKLIAALVTAGILTALYFLIRQHLKAFTQDVLERKGSPLSVFFAGGLMVFAKSIDGLSRKLEPFGIEPTEAVNHFAGSVEEIFEFTAAALIFVAAAGAFNYRSK